MSAVDDIAAYLAYFETGGNSIDQIIFDELLNGEEMNATERLRALLTERGVEWRGGLPTETMVEADGLDLLYVALPDGRVRAFIRNYLTPEQAVEATLGRGTCHLLPSSGGGFGCDRCYTWFPSMKEKTNYCPNCGARVVSDDD